MQRDSGSGLGGGGSKPVPPKSPVPLGGTSPQYQAWSVPSRLWRGRAGTQWLQEELEGKGVGTSSMKTPFACRHLACIEQPLWSSGCPEASTRPEGFSERRESLLSRRLALPTLRLSEEADQPSGLDMQISNQQAPDAHMPTPPKTPFLVPALSGRKG